MNFNLKGEQYKSCDRRSNETHTPFTILNQNFYEMDLIWYVMENGKLGTERLHDDYRKMLKPSICLLKIGLLFTLLFFQYIEHTFTIDNHSFVVGET